ncbi:hypothetical protein H632_c1983p0, partial [Helicosporidium sp. ATCC 50920]
MQCFICCLFNYTRSLADVGLSTACREVVDKSDDKVLHAIEETMLAVAHTILQGQGLSYDIPNRARGNQLYVQELDRIVLRDSVSQRPFANTAKCRKSVITTRILQLVQELCIKRIHVTKRDLFYTDVKLFEVTDIASDAKFVLLVEKDAAFMRLAEDRFYNTYPCIILTAKGQPDVATRLFLRKLKQTLKIPVLALVDSDPYGLKILSVYMKGSMNMSYDSSNLTTPDIKWLGVRPSDLDRFNIPSQCRLPMTDEDLKTGRKLLEEDFIKAHPEWVAELEIM